VPTEHIDKGVKVRDSLRHLADNDYSKKRSLIDSFGWAIYTIASDNGTHTPYETPEYPPDEIYCSGGYQFTDGFNFVDGRHFKKMSIYRLELINPDAGLNLKAKKDAISAVMNYILDGGRDKTSFRKVFRYQNSGYFAKKHHYRCSGKWLQMVCSCGAAFSK